MANRLHFDQGNIHLVLDVMTGELFELINKATGDNLLKNGMFKQKQPFTLAVKTSDGKTLQLSAPPHKRAFEGKRAETEYALISADYLAFQPKKSANNCKNNRKNSRFFQKGMLQYCFAMSIYCFLTEERNYERQKH